jgi:hypothetical protein|tara:strand:- start:140 stop:637 length:498 start_codon:yes stop_codon:yes gene_type:complete
MVYVSTDTLENTHFKIGKILGEYPELKHNTIATIEDAGAIPYFSKWQTYDYTLNDKMTIQNGFSVDRFYGNDPKLIFFYDANAGRSFKSLFDHFESGSMKDLEDFFIEKTSSIIGSDRYQIVTDPKFSNYDLITLYPRTYVFAEKEFSLENPELMDELIKNSIRG